MKRKNPYNDQQKPPVKSLEIVPLKPQIMDYSTIKATIMTLLNSGLKDVLRTVFALLRDRPYILQEMYKTLVEKVNDENINKPERDTIQFVLGEIFTKLWFISFKTNFPREIIDAFELDYLIKLPLISGHIKSLHKNKTEISVMDAFKFILRTSIGISSTYIDIFSKSLKKNNNTRISSLYFYYYRLPKNGKPYNYKGKKSKLNDYTTGNKYLTNDMVVYVGLDIKLRRIYCDIFYYLFLIKLVNLVISVTNVLPKDSDEVIRVIINQFYSVSKTYLLTQEYYIKNYRMDKKMDIIEKEKHFNFFSVFNNIFDGILLRLPEKYRSQCSVLFVNFYNEIGAREYVDIPNFLTDIIKKVEMEIDFPDEKEFFLYFRDDYNDDNLVIDYHKKFNWLYSYFDTETNSIKKLTPDEIMMMDNKMSVYWKGYIDYKLSLYTENQQIVRFSNFIIQ